ncbi:MAG: DNA polymerase III subunit delta [Myxococcales bacterium]|nr:DNA polymerase III subunit delta [Myxococcales bacterium]
MSPTLRLRSMATRSAAASPKEPKEPKESLVVVDDNGLNLELGTGRLRAVYVVTSGDDPNRPERSERPRADPAALIATARKIEEIALKRGDPALDYVRLDYLDGDFEAIGINNLIGNELRAQSLFGGRRVVTVVHAENLQFGEGKARGRAKAAKATEEDKRPTDQLEILLGRIDAHDANPPFVLIVVAETIDRRLVVWKSLIRAGMLVEVAPLTAMALQNYLISQGAPHNTRIAPQVAQKIWDRLGGSDAARLRSTADRLLLDAGIGGQLTVAAVEDTVPMDREGAVFAITDAIAQQDLVRALTVLHLLLGHGGPGEREGEVLKLVGFLASHYQSLAQVAAHMTAGRNQRDIEAATGLHPFRCEMMVRQLRTMKAGRLEMALQTVAELDIVMKSSALGDRKDSTSRWLEQALAALLRGHPLRLGRQRTALDTL